MSNFNIRAQHPIAQILNKIMGENTNNASEDRKKILFKEKKLIVLLIFFLSPLGHQPLPPGRTEFFFLNRLT